MNRILVVNVNWLGDAIMTTPVFGALKEQFPTSYLGVMTVERVKEVFKTNPYIDEVIIFDEKNSQRSLLAKIRFIKLLRAKKFDTAFLIHRSFTRAFICFLAGIRKRIGYARLKNILVLTQKVPRPLADIHRQDYYLYLFEKCGIPVTKRQPQFFIPDQARGRIIETLNLLRRKHPYVIGINPSANWKLKCWPPERFAELSDLMIKELRAAIIFIGVKKEELLIDKIIQSMNYGAYNFCSKTNLKELGALMEGMDLFISNDSGPAHLSAALGVNTLVLFGPTSPRITAPVGRKIKIIHKDSGCQVPCYNLGCKNNICMQNIMVEEVFSEVKNILSHHT